MPKRILLALPCTAILAHLVEWVDSAGWSVDRVWTLGLTFGVLVMLFNSSGR